MGYFLVYIVKNILPVAGYAEKNEPQIFAIPRPNNCVKQYMNETFTLNKIY
jgi:hypothetical protein